MGEELLELVESRSYLEYTQGSNFYHRNREALARVVVHGGKQPTLYFNYSAQDNNYSKLWADEGSPLLVHSAAIAVNLRAVLDSQVRGGVPVALGMSYGKPSLSAAIDELAEAGARQIVVLPLYPQYSTTTTASVRDAVSTQSGDQPAALLLAGHPQQLGGGEDAVTGVVRLQPVQRLLADQRDVLAVVGDFRPEPWC